MIKFLLLLGLTLGVNVKINASVIVPVSNSSVVVNVKTWKNLRDAHVVKQDKDYSCGAASMATLLNEFYAQSLTEEELLKAMDKGDNTYSFNDMAKILPEFGFRGVGYALSFAQLAKLKIPTIVYLKHRKNDHFSVVRGINNNTVWLADSSLGNVTYSKEQFLKMWETRGDAILKGKILAILPNSNVGQAVDFFTKAPERQSALAVKAQILHYF